jgi:hypothetical protein
LDHITSAATTLVMRNVRRGTVLEPAELKRALGGLKGHGGQMTSHALSAYVPNWLVDALERRADDPHLRFAVYPTLDRTDKVLTVTLQCESIQLRLAMLLSEPAVQAYLAEALPARRLCFVLGIEYSMQNAAMGASLSSEEAEWLLANTGDARPGPHGLAPAVQLAVLQAHPDCVPTLVNDRQVTDILSVLVTTRSQADINAAVNAAVLPDGEEQSQATWH